MPDPLVTPHLGLRKALRWIGRLLLVLGALGGVLFLAVILSPWTWLPAAVQPAPPTPKQVRLTESAAQALAAGDLPRAQRQLEEALAQAPSHVPALALQACVALEAGDTQMADRTLARLESTSPGRVEARLLQRLLEYRTRAPELGWRRAFLRAWTELGRPSFLDSPLLLHESDLAKTRDPIPMEAWEQAASTPVRLAFLLAKPTLTEQNARWLLGQLPALEDAALVYAVSVALLSAQLPPALHEEARAGVRHRLMRLVETSPQVMQPRLLLLWAESSEWAALSERELEALEVIMALPTWKDTSFTRTFLEARMNLKEAGISNPGKGAFAVALWSNTHWATFLLIERAQSTRSQLLPAARHRLGRILWNMGARLSQQSTVLERMTGLQLMLAGATDMGDDGGSERVRGDMSEASLIFNAAAQAALEKWPLPSLWEEVAEARARGEWDHLREFAGLPDGSPRESQPGEP
jgi:hypothetical protein